MRLIMALLLGAFLGIGGTLLYAGTERGQLVAEQSQAWVAGMWRDLPAAGARVAEGQRTRIEAITADAGELALAASDYLGVLTSVSAGRAADAWRAIPDVAGLGDTVSEWQDELRLTELTAAQSASELIALFRPRSYAIAKPDGFDAHAAFYRCPVIKVSNAGPVAADGRLLDYTPLVATPAGDLLRAPVEGGCLSSGYGPRGTSGAFRSHAGVDYYNREGGLIYAAGPGVVTTAGDDGAFGQTVRIDHGQGVLTLYAHLVPGSIRVQPGDTVALGQAIGMMGSSGRAFAVHLHYELRVEGDLVDPLQKAPIAIRRAAL